MAKYVHNYVAEIAKEMCGIAYEDMARDNQFYKMWPNQRNFIRKNWKNFVRMARAQLATMLTMDRYTEDQKEDIMQALLLDRALPPNGDTSVQVPTASLAH